MQSLRTRKPTQRQPTKLAKPANRDARKSRVDDKIKKRMSTRYADISAPTDLAGAIPPVPTIPIAGGQLLQLQQQPSIAQNFVTEPEEIKGDSRISDRKILEDEHFDPDAFIKAKLANSTESELKTLQSSLRATKDDTSLDLQRNVFKNYVEFVTVSKEISTLENELLELKESLAEWKSMPSLLHIDDSTATADRRRNTRSSVADLRILYANQMQTLHAQIEGSAKFAPNTPGRHVVAEVDNIVQLNAATYKVDYPVRFVILDDVILVARRRRRRNAADNGKLVAERCWSLNDMLILDTKDAPNMANVFKIRHGKETHVYKADTAPDKKGLLAQLRQVSDELSARKRKEREGEHERRRTMWQGNGDSANAEGGPSSAPDWMVMYGPKTGDSLKDKAEADARWVGEFSDELTVAIALRQWEQAVSLVEKGKLKLLSIPTLAAKLNPLTTSITSALLHCLSNPNNTKSTVISLVSLLVRLNAGPAARTTFLAARSETMRRFVRAIRFEGHVGLYVHDLATVMFTAMKHTADWFLASFKENSMASSFVEWAHAQMTHYAEIFRRQVYTSDSDPKVIQDATTITHSLSRKLLQEFGLDFKYLLDNLLQEHPKEDILPQERPDLLLQIRSVSSSSSIRTPKTSVTTRDAPAINVTSLPSPPLPTTSTTSTATATPRTKSPGPTPARNRTPRPAPISSVSTLAPDSIPSALLASSASASSASGFQPPMAAPTPRRIVRSPATPQPPRSTSPPSSDEMAAAYEETAMAPVIPVSQVPQIPLALQPRSPSQLRPPRMPRASPAPPPPRSINRPGSVSTSSTGSGVAVLPGKAPPVAVPSRDGMI